LRREPRERAGEGGELGREKLPAEERRVGGEPGLALAEADGVAAAQPDHEVRAMDLLGRDPRPGATRRTADLRIAAKPPAPTIAATVRRDGSIPAPEDRHRATSGCRQPDVR